MNDMVKMFRKVKEKLSKWNGIVGETRWGHLQLAALISVLTTIRVEHKWYMEKVISLPYCMFSYSNMHFCCIMLKDKHSDRDTVPDLSGTAAEQPHGNLQDHQGLSKQIGST